jgi:hypothetical protein
MLTITATTLSDISPFAAHQCELLCHEGSEMQQLFRRARTAGLDAQEKCWRVVYATYWTMDDTLMVAGWASLTDWHVEGERRPQAQGFVAPTHRKRGIATALCVCLTHGLTKDELPVAVFSEEFGAIARRLHWESTQYKSVDDGWIAVASFASPQGRDGTAGDDQG